MAKRIHIVIVESSVIIRSGLISILQRGSNINIDIAELVDISSLAEDLTRLNPDIIAINPIHFGLFPPSKLREYCSNTRIVALQSSLADQNTISSYDSVISIYDSAETIREALSHVAQTEEQAEVRSELSQREKEVVVCVARGMSNKEIADTLNLSTHTVISHRRNISAKLNIHSPSGLTIYAIVNKLIDVASIPAK